MSWIGEIILDRSSDPKDPSIVEVGDFAFFGEGTVRIENRAFKKKEPIDFHFGGNHAFRDSGSKRLTVWTAAGERFVFEFRDSLSGGRWIRWTPRAVDDSGTPDGDAVASTSDSVWLWIHDLVANVLGAIGWLLIGLAIVVLLIGLAGK